MAAAYQTLQHVFDDVRFQVTKDSTTLSDSDLLRVANKYYFLLFREIVSLNEDLYAEIAYSDLVADQREYPLPTDDTSSTYGGGAIKIQRVEITYDGTNWFVADPISWQQIPSATVTDADVNEQFDKTDPKYAFKDRSLFIAPVPSSSDDVSASNANLYIFYIKRPNELASTASVPNLPKDFLGLLAEGMLIDVFRRFNRTTDSQYAQRAWENGVEKMKSLEAQPDSEEQLNLRAAIKNYE